MNEFQTPITNPGAGRQPEAGPEGATGHQPTNMGIIIVSEAVSCLPPHEDSDTYTRVPATWLNENRLRPSEFRILLYLSQFRKKAHPSLWTIQDGTGLSRRTVIQALGGLRDAGILSWKQGGYGQGSFPNRANVYTIHDYAQWDLSSRRAKASGTKDKSNHYTKDPAKQSGTVERLAPPAIDAADPEVNTL